MIDMRIKLTKDMIIQVYVNQKKSLQDTADYFGVNITTIFRNMIKYGIPRRSLSDAGAIRTINHPMTEETKHIKSENTKKQMSNPEARKHISDCRKRFLSNPENHPRFGKHLTEEQKKKQGEAIRKTFEEKGGHSKESRKKMSIGHKGQHHSPRTEFTRESSLAVKTPEYKEHHRTVMKGLWENEDYRNHIVHYARKSANMRPNKLEGRILSIIEKNNLPYKYVGDGSIIFNGYCPDFIHTGDEKKIIEVFGTYWHRDKKDLIEAQTEEFKNKFYAELGYKLLILWEDEIKKMSDHDILKKITMFL